MGRTLRVPAGQAGLIIGHDSSWDWTFVLQIHPRLRSTDNGFDEPVHVFVLRSDRGQSVPADL